MSAGPGTAELPTPTQRRTGMASEDKITIDTFKIVTGAIAESHDLEIMANHLCQLLVAALQIKGCSIFLMNLDTHELELLANFGLSTHYLAKGPVLAEKSIGCTIKGIPVIVPDVSRDERIQYPEAAKKEGIFTICSIPIFFLRKVIGCLRLYHHERWEVTETDVESLVLLAENIGLAIRYTSLLNVVRILHDAVGTLPVDLEEMLRSG
jgi:signal transduction protein with GAF and PtsI domain